MTLEMVRSDRGYTWRNGRTWHPAFPEGNGPGDCFEIEWDENGNGKPTGQRADKTLNACLDSQRAPVVTE